MYGDTYKINWRIKVCRTSPYLWFGLIKATRGADIVMTKKTISNMTNQGMQLDSQDGVDKDTLTLV